MSYLEECFAQGALYTPLPESDWVFAKCLHTGEFPHSPGLMTTFLDAEALRNQVFEPVPNAQGTELNNKPSLLVPQFCLEPVEIHGRERHARKFFFRARREPMLDFINHLFLQLLSKPSVSKFQLNTTTILVENKAGHYTTFNYETYEARKYR